jgi:hypothetical protein
LWGFTALATLGGSRSHNSQLADLHKGGPSCGGLGGTLGGRHEGGEQLKALEHLARILHTTGQ